MLIENLRLDRYNRDKQVRESRDKEMIDVDQWYKKKQNEHSAKYKKAMSIAQFPTIKNVNSVGYNLLNFDC